MSLNGQYLCLANMYILSLLNLKVYLPLTEKSDGIKMEIAMPSGWRTLDLKLIPSRMEIPAIAVKNHFDQENPHIVFNWDSKSIGALAVSFK